MPKKLISLRVDIETLDWFRTHFSKGYQTRMNEVLRKHREDYELQKHLIIERAQQLFLRYYAQCFWHLDRNLQITESLVPVVQEGLKKYAGVTGFQLADTLDLQRLGRSSAN